MSSILNEKSRRLRYLDVSGIAFDLTSISFLAHALHPLTMKQTLHNIANLSSDVENTPHETPVSHRTSLEILRLNDCELRASLIAELGNIWCDRSLLVAGLELSNVKALTLCHNSLNVDSALSLAPLLKFKNITRLDIGNNNLQV